MRASERASYAVELGERIHVGGGGGSGSSGRAMVVRQARAQPTCLPACVLTRSLTHSRTHRTPRTTAVHA